MKKQYIILLLMTLLSVVVQAQINFVDRATALGASMASGDLEYGSGISFCDYNNDGWDDITIGTQVGSPVEFFTNNQDGTFSRDAFTITDFNTQNRQVIWVDFDNDGDKDLFVASDLNGNHLYKNNGAFVFTEVTATAGLPTNNMFTWGASWGDINNDGLLDVFISNRDDNFVQQNLLFQNNGNGTFTDISLAAGIHTTGHLSFCSAFFDYDNDGWQDIYVANDKNFNENFLYHNNGDGTFTNLAAEAGVNIAIDAMSTTIGDYNNDGWFDIYVSNTPIGGNAFFQNNGDGTFTNVTATTQTEFNGFSWGAVFLDADNDMDLDLYASSSLDGSVPSLASAALFVSDGNGSFTIPNSGFVNDTRISHSNAIGDVDNDGYPEIIVNNANNEPVFLWKNEGTRTNNWLKVKLEGVQSNKDGIGSVIEIAVNGDKQYRYTLCGEGYISQNSGTEFFGLGTYNTVDYVKVTWLSGMVDYFENVNANQLLAITEGSSPLSVADVEMANSIQIYPNPVNGVFHIKTSQYFEQLQIFNIVGQKVKNLALSDTQTTVNISTLPSGIYFIKVSSKTASQTVKIIKK